MKVPKIRINGEFYHGTVVTGSNLIYTFNSDYSDWDAVWVTNDEEIAEEFADNWRNETDILAIYKVHVKLTGVADIDYDKYQEIAEYSGTRDLREFIPTLIDKGYNGWRTIGSIGSLQYDDFAIFDPSNIKILSVKLLTHGGWTEYMTLADAQEFLTNLNESMKPVIKKLLREGLFDRESKSQVNMMNEFIDFACDYLEIPHTKVKLQYDRNGIVTTAAYGERKVRVYAKDRAIVDIMRSIAHELTHMKQDLEGRLDQSHHDANNAAGSPIENEANYKAGEIIRKFGEKYPEIYI